MKELIGEGLGLLSFDAKVVSRIEQKQKSKSGNVIGNLYLPKPLSFSHQIMGTSERLKIKSNLTTPLLASYGIGVASGLSLQLTSSLKAKNFIPQYGTVMLDGRAIKLVESSRTSTNIPKAATKDLRVRVKGLYKGGDQLQIEKLALTSEGKAFNLESKIAAALSSRNVQASGSTFIDLKRTPF